MRSARLFIRTSLPFKLSFERWPRNPPGDKFDNSGRLTGTCLPDNGVVSSKQMRGFHRNIEGGGYVANPWRQPQPLSGFGRPARQDGMSSRKFGDRMVPRMAGFRWPGEDVGEVWKLPDN